VRIFCQNILKICIYFFEPSQLRCNHIGNEILRSADSLEEFIENLFSEYAKGVGCAKQAGVHFFRLWHPGGQAINRIAPKLRFRKEYQRTLSVELIKAEI
jgi:hypothetical protein